MKERCMRSLTAMLGVTILVNGCGKMKVEEAVIGVAKCRAYSDAELLQGSQTLPSGTDVAVIEVKDEVVRVEFNAGHAWVHAYSLCSREEYERRQEMGQIPDRVITIAFENGGFALTGGTVTIANDRPTASPGQGFWMAPSTEGHPFLIASTECVRGKHLYFMDEAGGVVKLPIWRGTSTPSKRQTVVARTPAPPAALSLLGYSTAGELGIRLAELDGKPEIVAILNGDEKAAMGAIIAGKTEIVTEAGCYIGRAQELDRFAGMFMSHLAGIVWDAAEETPVATLKYTKEKPLALESVEWTTGRNTTFAFHGTLAVMLSFKTVRDWKRPESTGTEQLCMLSTQRLELTDGEDKRLIVEPGTRLLFTSATRFCSIDHNTTHALATRLSEREGTDITDLLRKKLDAFIKTFGQHLKALTWDKEDEAVLATLVYTEDEPVIWEAPTRFMYNGTLTVLLSPDVTPPDINRWTDPAGRVELQMAIKGSVEFTNAKGERRTIEPGTRVTFWGSTTFGRRS